MKDVYFLLPEIIVAGGSLLVFLLEPVSSKEESQKYSYLLLISLIGALSILLSLSIFAPRSVFQQTFIFDNFSIFLKSLILISGAVISFLSTYSKELTSTNAMGEFSGILGFSIVGAMVCCSAGDFITMVIALETLSMLSYVLAGFSRNSLSKEASLKYLLYGAFSTAILLFGISLIYWAGGSLFFKTLNLSLPLNPYKKFIFVGLGIVLTGLFFKIAAVPFHMWCPDVYQGSPTLITAYFSFVPKAAGFAVIMRVLIDAFMRRVTTSDAGFAPFAGFDWRTLISIISALTMTVGNFSALLQKDLKRMLAYSSIAHAGYMLMGLSAGSITGFSSILFYLFVYFLMNVGAFIIVLGAEEKAGDSSLESVKGLGWHDPLSSISFAVFLLSLTGIPPFGGFAGKLLLFGSTIEEKIYWLAILGILNSVISLGYYGIILKKMFLEEGEKKFVIQRVFSVTAFILGLATLLAGIFFQPFIKFAESGVRYLGGMW